MTKKQLNKEYTKVMMKAEEAIGRKAAVSLLRKADSIRKKLYEIDQLEFPLIHNG